MELLITYQNELLAVAAILIVILVYIVIKSRTAGAEPEKKKTETIEIEEPVQIVEEEIIKEEPVVAQTEEENVDVSLDGTEEGDFGVEEEENEVQKEQTEKEIKVQNIQKRDVPPHAKIVKEDFKEFAGKRILVAEDNIINQKVIQGLLADSGIEIVIANDGVEVLEILQKDNNFNIILMDAHMPRMDGFEATRQIRLNPQYNHIVVVALSGDTAADDIRKMNEAGMTEHLEKPLKMDAFYDILYAYTPLKQEENLNKYSEIDIEKGLEIAGDDTAFYNEILQEFTQSYQDAYDELERLIQNNKLTEADQLLLDLSGVAANIGADKLHKTAVSLKTALKNSDNEKSRLLFDFKEHLSNLLKEVKQYLL